MSIICKENLKISNIAENSGPRERYYYSKKKDHIMRAINLNDGSEYISCLFVPDGWRTKNNQDDFDSIYLKMKRRPPVNKKRPKVKAVDLFCGCGGLSLGAWEACRAIGLFFKPILAVDNDRRVLDIYRKNFRSTKILEEDISKIINGKFGLNKTKEELEILDQIKNIDILLSGPPCQGHSNLNNHTRRSDDRNALYGTIVRFAEISHPKHILVENVPQVLLDKGDILRISIKQLKKLGYNISDDVIDLSTIGVPQNRKRHVLIASLEKSLEVKDIVEKYRVKKERNLRWAINDLKYVENGRQFDTPSELSEDNVKRINYLFNKKVYELPNKIRPICHQKTHNYFSMYGRLNWKNPAPTITTGFLSPGQGRYIHPQRHRTITPHEAARIQFFPDFFDFDSAPTRESWKKMIGNAAPMKLAYIFTLELLA